MIKGSHLEKVMCPLFIVGTKVVPEEEVQHRLKNYYCLIITDIYIETRILTFLERRRMRVQSIVPEKRQLFASGIHFASEKTMNINKMQKKAQHLRFQSLN